MPIYLCQVAVSMRRPPKHSTSAEARMNKHEIERIFAYDSGRKPHRYASGEAPHADGDITVVRRPNLRMTFRTAPGCPLARPGAPFDANEPRYPRIPQISGFGVSRESARRYDSMASIYVSASTASIAHTGQWRKNRSSFVTSTSA